MTKKYVGFDIEVARFPAEDSGDDWDAKLGITCAAAMCSDEDEPKIWWDQNMLTGEAEPEMYQESVQDMAMWLNQKYLNGYKIVTWNGLSFDFRVLAAESGLHRLCQHLAYNHLDLMFQIFCIKGFPVGLKAVSTAMSEAMGGIHKMDDMDGKEAVNLWPGQYEKVLEYVGLDARSTLALAQAVDTELAVRWTSKKGTPMRVPIMNMLTVGECLRLPLPDTDWMKQETGRVPWTRAKFAGWLDRILETEDEKSELNSAT